MEFLLQLFGTRNNFPRRFYLVNCILKSMNVEKNPQSQKKSGVKTPLFEIFPKFSAKALACCADSYDFIDVLRFFFRGIKRRDKQTIQSRKRKKRCHISFNV